MRVRRTILAVCLSALALTPVLASAEGKFSAWVFGDYYYFADNHDSVLVDQNGFWFRIVNLTWDEEFDDELSARLKIESASPGSFTNSPASMLTYMKDVWIKWSRSDQAVILGLSTTVSHSYTEDIWGYRHLEKIPFEMAGFGGSRDVGLAVTGAVLAENRLGYHIMLANGNGLLNEQDGEKRISGSLRYQLSGTLSVEMYGDFEDRPDNSDRVTFRGFAGYRAEKARAGVEYVQQTRDQPSGGSYDLRVVSGFVTGKVAEKVWLVARVDRHLDADPNYSAASPPGRPYFPWDASVTSTFVLAGMELVARENVTFTPNVEATVYDAPDGGGPDPADDIVARVTFMFKY
ncbi:MAG TPA: hypothetical protein VFT13_00655 [Candidatus Krumholzibacteria bacterium]|nr:hypothetical protein [Candidatus Krumholzibacteria bacterium]